MEASEFKVRNLGQTVQISNTQTRVWEKGNRRKVRCLALEASGTHEVQLLNPSAGRPVGQNPRERWTLQKPGASALARAFSIRHLSPFINNHLSQEWPISKAIPSSLALPSGAALGSGGNGVINAELQASLSLPAPVSFPSLIKRPLSLAFPFSSPSWVCKRGAAFYCMVWQVEENADDKSQGKLGAGM